MQKSCFAIALLLLASSALADISITDRSTTLRHIAAAQAATKGEGRRAAGNSFRAAPNTTGSVHLDDASGLRYFINTNITFSTTKSASGAASEASYQHAVVASTSGGGVVSSTLDDMFDGYGAICVSLTNATGPCATGSANYTMYNKNGGAVVDSSVPSVSYCTNRQYVFPTQTIGGISVRRKVYVPNNTSFIRWMNIFTNTTGAPITFTMVTSNNLGSDSNTVIVTSSNGNATAEPSDLWLTSFQNWDSHGKSSDPRFGHVFQGAGAATPMSNIHFVTGNDTPYWSYGMTLAPGQTKIIVTYATGSGTKAAVATQAASIAAFGPGPQQCMSPTELTEVANFNASTAFIPALSEWMLALLAVALAAVALTRRV